MAAMGIPINFDHAYAFRQTNHMKRLLLSFVVMALVSLVQAEESKEIAEMRAKAEAGLASAQSSLGVSYRVGDGVPKDDTKAVKWYRLAAEQGDSEAQFNLGIIYAKGFGAAMEFPFYITQFPSKRGFSLVGFYFTNGYPHVLKIDTWSDERKFLLV